MTLLGLPWKRCDVIPSDPLPVSSHCLEEASAVIGTDLHQPMMRVSSILTQIFSRDLLIHPLTVSLLEPGKAKSYRNSNRNRLPQEGYIEELQDFLSAVFKTVFVNF